MKLLPCPFCGADSARSGESATEFVFTVECRLCGAEGPTAAENEDAEHGWNVRAGKPTETA